ncbi:hypothetical protein Tco_0689162, partial [Tanacetum coccineum]
VVVVEGDAAAGGAVDGDLGGTGEIFRLGNPVSPLRLEKKSE